MIQVRKEVRGWLSMSDWEGIDTVSIPVRNQIRDSLCGTRSNIKNNIVNEMEET